MRALIDRESKTAAARVGEWLETATPLFAPPLLKYEAANALHRQVVGGSMKLSSAIRAMEEILAMPIHFVDAPFQHAKALEVASRFHLGASYDAHYLAISEAMELEFWTGDKRLYNAVSHHLPWVHLVE